MRDALCDGRMRCARKFPSRLASRDAIFSDFHRALYRAMRCARETHRSSHRAMRCARETHRSSHRAMRCARETHRSSHRAMRCAREKHRSSHRAMRCARENIVPRIARCEARCFFIVKRARVFTAGVILLTNPLRANNHMVKISHFRRRHLHPRFYQELTAIFSSKSCVAVSFGVVHN